MAETYKISAVPMLLTEGEHEGGLHGVNFTAVSAIGSKKWFTLNCGQFESAFAKLMTRSAAKVIVASLMEGDAIELPGRHDEQRFECHFAYEWSPIYFVLPAPTHLENSYRNSRT